MQLDPLIAAPRLIEVAHVAHRLSVSVGYVRRLIHTRQLPAVRLGRSYRIVEHELQAFIDAQRVRKD